MTATRVRQSGIALLEALIGILLFSLGILAMVAMQAASVNAVADAQYRIEAVNATNQLLAQMWTAVDRSSAGATQNSLLSFEHQTSGAPNECNFSGNPANAGVVTNWLAHLNSGGPSGAPLLPGATPAMQQIEVDTGASNRVTITLCWQAPNDTTPRRHTVVAYIH
ncbi:MAG: type IV pilus modification protein PilV [Burkholderiales bacterium]